MSIRLPYDQLFLSSLSLFLKTKRLKAGLSQKEIGAKLGYNSAQFISNWERGKASPPLQTIVKLIVIYSIPLEEIIELLSTHTLRIIKDEISREHSKQIQTNN